MHEKTFPNFLLVVAAAAALSGCALFGSKGSDSPEIPEEEAFSPIRTKYRTVTSRDLGSTEVLRIAVVDVNFEGDEMRMEFEPAEFRPQTGLCQLLGGRKEPKSLAALVAAIDPYIDRMPFGVLFTYRGRLTSSPEVSATLPEAYTAFYREFQAAMRAEDIDFVCLLPERAVFVR